MSQQRVITQGEFCATAEVNTTISTLLGSCVACCLWDPLAAVGGMNHILLASTSRNRTTCDLAGINAMELLINGLLKLGARRDRLRAKAFGGAQMIEGLSDIGSANCDFITGFLAQEDIDCVSKSLGGRLARHVVFTPSTGAARVKMKQQRIAEPSSPIVQTAVIDLELF